MVDITQIPIYIVNYKNEGRRNRMKERFNSFGLEPIFTPPVEGDDSRLINAPISCKRVWAVMLQHLDSIRHYCETSNSPYCIVCEDDIHISRSFISDLENLLPHVEEMQLDLVMLGYLLPFKIEMTTYLHAQHFPLIRNTGQFTLHRYPNDIWGSQMYLFPRRYADVMIELYDINNAFKNLGNSDYNYNPDWTLTKNGNRALISPMIAVEEGVNVSGDEGQIHYHMLCHNTNYEQK
jgi:hypothetical protein